MTAGADRLAAEEPVKAVQAALEGSGVEAWVVGGTVRDALLGHELRDLDLAVRGDAEQPARAVGRALGGPAFCLYEELGVWRALDRERKWECDVTPLQGETIEADLAGRDFTVNAMALPLEGEDLIDPYGGAADLEAGVLRVLDESAYLADSLRPLRLARLATELALDPEPETERLTRAAAGRVPEASPERVFMELRRLVSADRALEGLELADRLGLTAAVLPEVDALHRVEQSHFHHLDAYEHTLEVLRQEIHLEERPEEAFGELAVPLREVLEEPLADDLTRGQALRFAALLHDVGKPATRGVRPDGRVTFVGHDAVGERMVSAICRRLRVSARLRDYLAKLTRHHLVLGFMVHERPLSRRAAYRYLKTCEPVEVEVTALSYADRLATRGRRAEPAIAAHLEVARELMAEALTWRAGGPPRLPVRGDELARELGMEPGPELGALLADLQEARFAEEAQTREQTLELARRLRHNPKR